MKRSINNPVSAVLIVVFVVLFCGIPFTSEAHVGAEKKKAVYPNPFTERTTFQLTVPREAKIKIDVYNIRGQHIRNLFGGAGGELHPVVKDHPVSWDGKDKFGVAVPHGIYVCVLVSENTIVKSVKVVKAGV
ncbi:MAG: T9SS type A sorting domain-containing protein [Chlorobi bacterium]|nr:T9SS type A sorting domain-containing protein [Chlorobiota bacterium]